MRVEDILTAEELVSLKLRSLYSQNGYAQYKMSKFEEYDLYAANKDFLESERIITFTDTTGKLMALKPDVTLSIIKNTELKTGEIKKVYYNENVYRVPKNSPAFKEITQTGLECIGDISQSSVAEVIRLAVLSLAEISENSVLDISHFGLIDETLKTASLSGQAFKQTLKALYEKNAYEIGNICASDGVSAKDCERISALAKVYGSPKDVLPELKNIFGENESVKELEVLVKALEMSCDTKNINIDFSVPGNIKYYNGIVFKGYIKGIPNYVLSGGQYDKLMERLKKNVKAIGFAVYLDAIELLERAAGGEDLWKC
ncbi:MAG: ATP phosphoribosyltransferase regulatory subunit [Oscillospiraceae bacterium]|nr:ATP phosphoribosyltransferase regulatory subunit [Oscillospiraceae bacterium]